MEHTIVHDLTIDILIVTLQGDWEAEKDDMLVRDTLNMVASTGIRKILVDLRRLTKLDFSALSLYERVQRVQDRRRAAETASSKVAILYAARDPKAREGFQFFENITRNRGLPYRLFEDHEDAIEWLTAA